MEIISQTSDAADRIDDCLSRIRSGDRSGREELLQLAGDRLLAITRKIKRTYPDLARWEQTDDVFQTAMMRLMRAIDQVELQSSEHFFRLAAMHIRRELIDLVRHWQGPCGPGRLHATQSPVGRNSGPIIPEHGQQTLDPSRIAEWIEFHEAVENLPDDVRAVFDLLFYQGLPQETAAELLGVDVRTIKRRWREARLALHSRLETAPGLD
jgi:RNA polymerase sigma factor (sigma-70 family)